MTTFTGHLMEYVWGQPYLLTHKLTTQRQDRSKRTVADAFEVDQIVGQFKISNRFYLFLVIAHLIDFHFVVAECVKGFFPNETEEKVKKAMGTKFNNTRR